MNIAARKLTTFLKIRGIARSAFAERVNVRSSTITRLLNGKRKPSLELADRIFQQTDGDVTPTDWIRPESDGSKDVDCRLTAQAAPAA